MYGKHMSNRYEGMTDDQLVSHANDGQAGQGSIVESMRRLREAIVKEESAIKSFTATLVKLTVALVVLTLGIFIFAGATIWWRH
jgi:CHASE3 domain sensor protein